MADTDLLTHLIAQAKRIAPHHPELAAAYLAAIRERARGVPPAELDRLLGDLPALAGAPRLPLV